MKHRVKNNAKSSGRDARPVRRAFLVALVTFVVTVIVGLTVVALTLGRTIVGQVTLPLDTCFSVVEVTGPVTGSDRYVTGTRDFSFICRSEAEGHVTGVDIAGSRDITIQILPNDTVPSPNVPVIGYYPNDKRYGSTGRDLVVTYDPAPPLSVSQVPSGVMVVLGTLALAWLAFSPVLAVCAGLVSWLRSRKHHA